MDSGTTCQLDWDAGSFQCVNCIENYCNDTWNEPLTCQQEQTIIGCFQQGGSVLTCLAGNLGPCQSHGMGAGQACGICN
jgi:hypothetical protein